MRRFHRKPMRWISVPLVAMAVLGACGDGGVAGLREGPLDSVDEKLRDIESGTIDFTFAGRAGSDAPADGALGEEGPVGFRIAGPFSFSGDEGLPVAQLTYTRLLGAATEETTFISTGQAAFVKTDKGTFELPPEQVRGLQLGKDPSSESEGLGQLRLSKWFAGEPKRSTDGDADVFTGKVDAANVFADLASLSRQLGVGDATELTELTKEDRARLERMVEGSKLTIVAGKKDHILRSLEGDIALGAALDVRAKQAIRRLAGARLEIRLALTGPNQPVAVEPPSGAKPLP